MHPKLEQYSKKLEAIRTEWLFDETAIANFHNPNAEQHFLQAMAFIDLAQRSMKLAAINEIIYKEPYA